MPRALPALLLCVAVAGCFGARPDPAPAPGPDGGASDAGAPDGGSDGGAPDAGPGDGGAPDAGPADGGCADGQHVCSSQCVAEGPQSCGPSCALCPEPAHSIPSCRSGFCAFSCQQGYTQCGDACADLQRDLRHCGACGTACAAGSLCVAGACTAWSGQFDAPQLLLGLDAGAAVAVADMDGDGLDDVLLKKGPQYTELFLSSDGGTFTHVVESTGSEHSLTDWVDYTTGALVVAGDATGDGKPDVLVAKWRDFMSFVASPDGLQPMYPPSLSLGTGLGFWDGPLGQSALLLAPLSGAALPELVSAVDITTGNFGDRDYEQIVVHRNQGAGVFVLDYSLRHPAKLGPVVAARLSRGGAPGLAAIQTGWNTDPSKLVVFANAAGTLQAAQLLASDAYAPILAVDLDGDGLDDVVVGGVDGLRIFLGQGGASFKEGTAVSLAPRYLGAVATADLDGDGNADLVVYAAPKYGATDQTGRLQILLGKGDGTFSAMPAQTVEGDWLDLRVGRFDGDRYWDVLAVQPLAASVLRGQP
jgi:hypothetical protein